MGIDEVKQRAVFLDRDGVINEARVKNGKPYPPQLRDLKLTSRILETLMTLKSRGFLLFIVTNQPDVARKTLTMEDVSAIHAEICRQLPIDGVYTCFHDGPDECDCRKPRPGLILRAAKEHNIDLSRSYMVGDRWRDVDAGKTAGCHTVFVDYGYAEELRAVPDFVVRTTHEIATYIV